MVLAGVIGFPLLFDNQPRPIAVDIPIDIPDKTKVKPLVASNPVTDSKPAEIATQPASAPVAAAPQGAASRAANGAIVAAAKESTAVVKEAQKEEVIIPSGKPAAATMLAETEDKSATKAEAKPADKAAESAGRFVVQFGAFTDSAHAHEARLKVEKLGLKTYAQVVDGASGKKFRVRVGPFEKRSDAEKAAEKIKKVDLPAAILGL